MKYTILILIMALNARGEVKPVMQNFYNLTEKLQPYLIDKKAFLKNENAKDISSVLAEFSENTKKLKNEKMSLNDDMKFRVKLLNEDIEEAQSSFNNGFKDYSYWALKSTLNNCLNCHTQKGLPLTGYNLKKDNGGDAFDRAEFLFIVRNYPEALALYEDILTYYPKNKYSVESIESSAQKILFYSIRVSRNDNANVQIFDRILKNTELPQDLRNEIIAWRKYINLRKYRISEDESVNTEKQLEAYMQKRDGIADEYSGQRQRAAADLDTAHFLFKLLEKNNNPSLKPSILYYLARIESDYRISFFDMTSDNYLKECIEKYSSQKVAKKCFSLYKQLQTISFSGSGGTFMPLSVKRQLEKYEIMVNKK